MQLIRDGKADVAFSLSDTAYDAVKGNGTFKDKPADAKAYQEVTLARAERDAAISAAEARAREVELGAAAEAGKTKTIAAADAERVRLEATAHSEQTRMVGLAEADATRAKGMAEGEAVRAKGMAEAEAIKARADALAENQDAVIGQQLAEQWPQIVEAAAKPFGNIDQMIVLNGAKGLSDTLAQALSQGATGLDLARQLLAGKNGKRSNGAVPEETEPVAANNVSTSDR
jgi:uncharacterized membrane protein YqiK